ncbi:hypothetical protein DKP78_15440, partial [Enterococcus faecium]
FLTREDVLQGVFDLLHRSRRRAAGHVDPVVPHQLRALVLVDVEAAELLVLGFRGDGEGARGELPERSANHGCGGVGGSLLRSGNPTSVE